jgi:hypothetical protein
LAPSIRSGLFSGDGIVAAGRKGVFNRVAEARAAAAKASRVRAGRVRGDRLPSTDGSTASGSVVHPAQKSSTALVSKLILVYRTCILPVLMYICWETFSVNYNSFVHQVAQYIFLIMVISDIEKVSGLQCYVLEPVPNSNSNPFFHNILLRRRDKNGNLI